ASVQPVEDVTEKVLEVAEDRGLREDHRTGSNPPCDHGLHRSSRQAASAEPRTSPFVRNASIAYCEHDGSYLHVVGKSAPSVSRESHTRPTPSRPAVTP